MLLTILKQVREPSDPNLLLPLIEGFCLRILIKKTTYNIGNMEDAYENLKSLKNFETDIFKEF